MPVSNISTAAVHPLVLLNISEHTTRLVAQRRKDRTQPLLVCGALLGHQKESGWELFHSFELIFDQPEGSDRREFNYSHFTDRLDQIKKIFPADNFVGWYIVSSSTEVTREIKKLHQQILNFNPSALLLVYNASAASRSVADDDDQEMDVCVDGAGAGASAGACAGSNSLVLPITVYETLAPALVPGNKLNENAQTETDALGPVYYIEVNSIQNGSELVGSALASRLLPMKVTVDMGDAERIAVEHVANTSMVTSDETISGSGSGSGGSSSGGSTDAAAATAQPANASRMAMFLSSQRNALEMLHKDIRILASYIDDVMSGKAPFDPEVLQLVQRVLCNRPVVQNDGLFEYAMAQEETNCQMVAYLSSITGAVNAVRSVSQRSNTALQYARNKHTPVIKHGPGSGMFGMEGMSMFYGGGFGRSARSFGSFR